MEEIYHWGSRPNAADTDGDRHDHCQHAEHDANGRPPDLSFGENRGLRAGIAAGYAYARDHDYAFALPIVLSAATIDGAGKLTILESLSWLGGTFAASPRTSGRRAMVG